MVCRAFLSNFTVYGQILTGQCSNVSRPTKMHVVGKRFYFTEKHGAPCRIAMLFRSPTTRCENALGVSTIASCCESSVTVKLQRNAWRNNTIRQPFLSRFTD